MKKYFLTTALVLVILLFSVGVTADDESAVGYEQAINLKTLDLFMGTDIGFELEREPNRLEGAVMFVRLLGKEQEALQNNYAHPFNDVPDWGDPYVGYLYHNSLTNGISGTEFGSYMPIRAVSYMTFVLRALGYSDTGTDRDFNWDEAVDYAFGNQLIDEELYIELSQNGFLRGHVAWLSYESLLLKVRPGDLSLIDLLVSENIVERDAAVALGILSGEESIIPKILLGYSEQYLQELLGIPDFSAISRYGFEWKIYENGFSNYIQVGIEDESVVGLLSAAPGYSYERGIGVGMGKAALEEAYPEGEITEYRKPDPDGVTVWIYTLDNENKSTYVTDGGNYITYYFDSYDNNTITAFLVINNAIESRTIESFSNVDAELYESLERQIFGITNAFRKQKGFQPVIWEGNAAQAAVLHSMDMAEREFFSHYSPEGIGMGDRLTAQGVEYVSAGENIAFGYRNPIHMVNDWLNSQTGHREILLGDFTYLGVGVWIDGENRVYGTQDFWR